MAEDKMTKFGMKESELNKRILVLRTSYQMYEKTIRETERSMKTKLDKNKNKFYTQEQIDEQLESIKFAQKEVLDEYLMLGGKEEDLLIKIVDEGVEEDSRFKGRQVKNVLDLFKEKAKESKKTPKQVSKPINESISDVKPVKEEKKTVKKTKEVKKEENKEDIYTKIEKKKVEYVNYEKNNGFDLIPLPSKGECYPKSSNIPAKIAVAPLCGYDEDMIHAPGLYNDNVILDMLLKEKIIDKSIDPGELLDGDREAILLWLRADGYGNEYSVTATDNKTGKAFETEIDLSELKYKEFNLKGDENGLFDFTMPKSGDEIKFKFLNHSEKEGLRMLEDSEDKMLVKERLKIFVSTMDNFVSVSDLPSEELLDIKEAIRKIEAWEESLDENDSEFYTHGLTNSLEMSIVSINGNDDRMFIHDYVQNMPVKDSRSFREYIAKNEPGVDYHFTVEVPKSLGGGSRTVFLQFHQYIFLNVS